MKPIDKANVALHKSIEEAAGHLELMRLSGDTSLCQQAIRALERFSDNDDYIDAMYEEDLLMLKEE